ncbi:SOUL family heme-binding protein [Halobacterium wangiae]|uniref:SOUL family heme-binding protein n=1 Tax=Halobacterium wangiae TaxID=2902623 RepID=UPI001E52E8A5|nr:heme-binding protein [Halobacterium wangiae]
MRTTTRVLAAAAGVAATVGLAAAAVTYQSRQTERLDYDTVLTLDGVELRRYPETVLVESAAEDRREAFSRLFGYISGENTGERGIEMTAPVRIAGTRVPMTAPVRVRPTAVLPGGGERSAGEGVRMAFYLPADYTADSAPEPTDPDVDLVTEPARTVAVREFSWRPTDSRIRDHERRLLETLDEHGIEPTGDPFFLGYDSPGTLPFLRTNEVAVPVRAD